MFFPCKIRFWVFILNVKKLKMQRRCLMDCRSKMLCRGILWFAVLLDHAIMKMNWIVSSRVFSYFKRMLLEMVVPDYITLNGLICSCTRFYDAEMGIMMLRWEFSCTILQWKLDLIWIVLLAVLLLIYMQNVVLLKMLGGCFALLLLEIWLCGMYWFLATPSMSTLEHVILRQIHNEFKVKTTARSIVEHIIKRVPYTIDHFTKE